MIPELKKNTEAKMQKSIEALSPQEQRDPAWSYWKARATTARAPAGPEGPAPAA